MMLAIALVSLSTISCGGDDEDDDNTPNYGSNENNIEATTDYTATSSIKTVKLSYSSSYLFYQDYNYKDELCLFAGGIGVNHYVRDAGSYRTMNYGEGFVSRHKSECGIKDIGKVTSLSDIIFKNVSGGDGLFTGHYLTFTSTFQPNHGYSVLFSAENGEKKYMRIYAVDYSLDNSGSLESITIQYQLY